MTLATQSIRTPQFGGAMAATLQGEATKPANCFRINGTAKIEEGIKLELDHPAIGGKNALFIGERYIFRNHQYGAAYDSNGLVRRAVIEYKELPGKKPLPLLTQPNGFKIPLLLHVDTNLPAGVKPKEHFWTGVDTDEGIVAWGRNETLIELRDDQAWVDVFYGDGSVKRVIRMGPQLVAQNLSLEEQAERRIELALWNIQLAKDENSNDRVLREDRSYHQLIAILAIGGQRSEAIFDEVIDLLKGVGREGDLRPRVLQHAMEVLNGRFIRTHAMQTHIMQFEDACLASKFARHPDIPFSDGVVRERHSTPAERKKFLAERAIIRQQNAPKGMSGSGPQKHVATNPKTIAKREKQTKAAAAKRKKH